MPSTTGARRCTAARVALAIGAIAGLPASAPDRAVAAQAQAPRVPAETRTAPDTRLDEAARALSAGDAARALELGKAYLAQHHGDPRALVLLARAHLERDELDDAYARLERALRASPRNVDVLYYMGLVSGRLAAEQLEQVVERAPTSARAHQLLAETLVLQERRTEAEREYEAALAASPGLFDALLGLAKLKRIRLDCEGAIALYQKAEAIRPSFDGAYGLGSCLIREGDHAGAIARFGDAIERDPRSAVARVGLGSALLAAGRTADAIASLERAVAIEPAMGEGYYLLGRAYQLAGDRTRAQAAFARAQQVGRGEPLERR